MIKKLNEEVRHENHIHETNIQKEIPNGKHKKRLWNKMEQMEQMELINDI